ncbi:histone acetyltransferase KAT6B-like isoform X3 [Ostrea edulis]|uniref:histone acetyltransferase KAT6B-like isoform X3 n=1 Tax=Ostrea edulis TaxID=37623 RepID=UPI002094F993|nr:histone acetyltransferase KAT6B-like isoform X3 [Ostrea edulis]
MASQKCKESILQIIDQLRQRKARPDIVRICHMAARKHGMKWQETESHLEKLVESGTVVKVDYKGNVSYRNTTKWKKTHSWKKIVHSDLVCKNIISAVREIAQNSLDRGASVKEVDRWLNTNTPEPHLERNQIRAALDKEVENGHLKKLPNGNYISSESSNPEKKIAEKPSTSVTSPGKRGRPPSKRKKFKKTHGPDFETLSFGKRSMEDSSCDYCLQTEPIIRKEFKEGILVCQDCNAKAHPSCMGYNSILAKRALQSPWQCIDCKTCTVCLDSGDPDMMLFCDACDKGYHMNCHEPAIEEKPQGKWECQTCQETGAVRASMEVDEVNDIADDSRDENNTSCLPTPYESAASSDDDNRRVEVKRRSEEGSPSDQKKVYYPDASKWGVDDVARFFINLGYKDQAEALQEQEIDGQSLLLMKRSDVLIGLSIRLGPALKMYQHVMKLQLVGVDTVSN